MTAAATAPAPAVGSPSCTSSAEDTSSTTAVAAMPKAAVLPAAVSAGRGTSLAIVCASAFRCVHRSASRLSCKEPGKTRIVMPLGFVCKNKQKIAPLRAASRCTTKGMEMSTKPQRFMSPLAWAAAVAVLLFAAAPAQAAEPIKIGLGMSLTGPLAANGKMSLVAMQVWEDDINAKGGLLGRPVKLVYYDDQSSPSQVPGIYAKLLDVDKVDLIVSGYAST